jgi:hypothetical protein
MPVAPHPPADGECGASRLRQPLPTQSPRSRSMITQCVLPAPLCRWRMLNRRTSTIYQSVTVCQNINGKEANRFKTPNGCTIRYPPTPETIIRSVNPCFQTFEPDVRVPHLRRAVFARLRWERQLQARNPLHQALEDLSSRLLITIPAAAAPTMTTAKSNSQPQYWPGCRTARTK